MGTEERAWFLTPAGAGTQPTGINHPCPQLLGFKALHQAALAAPNTHKLTKTQLSPRIRDAFGSTAAFKSFPVVC